MMKSSPSDEAARLEALYQYQVLDTAPEPAFDHLTLLAAQICDVPIALISFVDGDRQWVKSRVGLEVAETSRDVSFCAHAIHQSELFIVRDALEDERFATNSLVTGEPSIRFYAGAPLITSAGYAIGTLCAIDRVPRELSGQQQEALRALARQVMTRESLQISGYTVLEAADGNEALRIYEQHKGQIDLTLTDVVMPQMGGRELVERLRSLCPQMRVLYMSGYTDSAIVHHGVLEAGTAFLQKPFTPISLTRNIREVLDG